MFVIVFIYITGNFSIMEGYLQFICLSGCSDGQ